MMMVQMLPESMQRRVMEQFPETKIGREIAKQLERQDLETRQALVAERERLTAAFEHRLPPLDAAISKVRKAAEKTRHAYLAADLVLRKAAGARYALVATHDRQRDGINATLRASSSPAIATFQAEMRDRENARRRNFSGQHYERLDRAAGKRLFFSNLPGIQREGAAIRAAQADAEALRESAVEDVLAALARLRDAIPAVGAPELVGEEKVQLW